MLQCVFHVLPSVETHLTIIGINNVDAVHNLIGELLPINSTQLQQGVCKCFDLDGISPLTILHLVAVQRSMPQHLNSPGQEWAKGAHQLANLALRRVHRVLVLSIISNSSSQPSFVFAVNIAGVVYPEILLLLVACIHQLEHIPAQQNILAIQNELHIILATEVEGCIHDAVGGMAPAQVAHIFDSLL